MTPGPTLGVKTFWATTFYTRMWPEHLTQAPQLTKLFHEIEARNTQTIASGVAPNAKPPQGLFESDFDLFMIQHPALQALQAFIRESVQFVVAHANGGKAEPRSIHVEIIDSWFHITRNGGFHDAHFHSGCSWCGIYYLQMGDMARAPGSGAPNGLNRFYSPINSGGAYRDYGNKYLEQSVIDVPAQEGMLLLFPSFLLHSGLPYRGSQERIVVSFNSRSLLKS